MNNTRQSSNNVNPTGRVLHACCSTTKKKKKIYNNFFLKHLHSIITIKLQLYTSLIKGSVKLAVSTSVDNVLTIKRK